MTSDSDGEKNEESENFQKIKLDTSNLDHESIKFVSEDKLTDQVTSTPTDKGNIVYIYFFLQGIGTLIPWNLFITIAPMYFINYKLREPTHLDTPTFYAINFFSFLGFFANLPQLFLQGLNIITPMKGKLSKRIKISIPCIGSVVGLTIALIYIDISDWIDIFFWITMVSVAFMCATNGIYQNSMFGLAANFPQKYTNGMILGANICGTFVSLINIITIAAITNVQLIAFVYFLIALITLAVCLISMYVVEGNKYYKYNMSVCTMEKEKLMEDESNQEDIYQKLIHVWNVSSQQYMNIFVLFFITLACFPHMLCDIPIYRSNGVYDFIVSEKFYVPVFTFLLFNFSTVIGTIAADYAKFIKPRHYWIPIYLRISILFILFFCNYHPSSRKLPIFIFNEWIPISMNVFLALTNAYFTSLIMMHLPKSVDSKYAQVAGMVGSFFIILGITIGVLFTFVITFVAENLELIILLLTLFFIPKCANNRPSESNKIPSSITKKRQIHSYPTENTSIKKKTKKKGRKNTDSEIKYSSQQSLQKNNSNLGQVKTKSTNDVMKEPSSNTSLQNKNSGNLNYNSKAGNILEMIKEKHGKEKQENVVKLPVNSQNKDVNKVVDKLKIIENTNKAPMAKEKEIKEGALDDEQNNSEIKLYEKVTETKPTQNIVQKKDSIKKGKNVDVKIKGSEKVEGVKQELDKKLNDNEEKYKSDKSDMLLPENGQYEKMENLMVSKNLQLENPLDLKKNEQVNNVIEKNDGCSEEKSINI
uniref:UDP-N-acetylglucosamine--dolichyl-phosphate N-acetylglucosaminephosphotransferase n=1 Tax=Strongyloides stercoralis TaxID=6248 RepID=A0AAF5CQS9_STRER